MGRHSLDITNQQFGKLIAIKVVGKSGRENVWLCECECGKLTEVRVGNLGSGNSQSCGCYRKGRKWQSK